MLIHGQVPPGVPVLQALKAELKYSYEDIDRGGRVRIATQNTKALKAAHEFLRFQIADHQTGDTAGITKDTAAGKDNTHLPAITSEHYSPFT